MLIGIVSAIGVINFMSQSIQFVTDPYAIYVAIRNIRLAVQTVTTSPLIEEDEDGWAVVDEWEMVETKNLF